MTSPCSEHKKPQQGESNRLTFTFTFTFTFKDFTMKKTILSSLLGAALLMAGAAHAQTFASIPLNGTLTKACTVTAFLNGPFNALNMTSTALQGAESLSPICNYGGTLSVQFTSANAGSMNSGLNTVPYTFTVSGGLLNAVSLATPQTVLTWPAVANAVQTRSMNVTLASAATIAGTYSDTITATVTPN
jgi:hypothetical protein